MCNHTYHHYPSCGHISNWSVTSCHEYTNKLRLVGPERRASCEAISTSHDLLQSNKPSMCVQCESDWAYSISHGETEKPYRSIEGLSFTGSIIEIDARMTRACDTASETDAENRDARSTSHSDNGQIFLSAIAGRDGDLENTDHSDNGRVFPGAVAHDGDAGCADHSDNGQGFSGAVDDSASGVVLSSPVAGSIDFVWPALATTSNQQQIFDFSSVYEDRILSHSSSPDGSSSFNECVCESPDGSIDHFPGAIYAPLPCMPLTKDWNSSNFETFGIESGRYVANCGVVQKMEESYITDACVPCLLDVCATEIDGEKELPEINVYSLEERIEATVLKRIEEDNEKEHRRVTISKLLDTALLQKDANDRREQEAAQGISHDPHLWDTESINNLFKAAPVRNYASSQVSPHSSPKISSHSRSAGPQPTMHLYLGNMFAGTEEQAHKNGLREIRPFMDQPGEWEGMMRAFSADDANRMGLLDPIHMRGCCDERPASWHLYYGMMRADSERDAEMRHLEDIQRVPGFNDRFYGTLPADDLAHARAMGLSDVQHLWGCCKDGRVQLPKPVKHRYSGIMAATSLADVVNRGLCDAQPVPGECGDYYGGLYYGSVVVNCELEAWNMGMRKIEHVDCCAEVEAVVGREADAFPDAQCTFYGYMFAHSEQELIDRGLQCALLVPGTTTKYSGRLQAGSADEAMAMGLIEPSRIEWGVMGMLQDFLEI